jgi:hypothetical protein
MQGVFSATATEFLELNTIRIVAAILLGCVIAFLAVNASKVNDHANVFFSHVILCKTNQVNKGAVHYLYDCAQSNSNRVLETSPGFR